MSPEEGTGAKCPKCQGELSYIEHYQSYYCANCDEHFDVKPQDMAGEPPDEAPRELTSFLA